MERPRLPIIILVAVIALAGIGFTRLGTNLWGLATEPAYLIPEESSILRFSPTVMTPGSGDWWVYGEDSKFFYALSSGTRRPYRAYPKASTEDCPGFIPTNNATWCAEN